MLAEPELRWLMDEAQETFGLTPARTRVLLAVLARDEFTLREIGRATEQSPDSVRAALELLAAREILELRVTGARRGPRAAHLAIAGRRLRFILDAVRLMAEQPTP
jgi:hypothetical protein